MGIKGLDHSTLPKDLQWALNHFKGTDSGALKRYRAKLLEKNPSEESFKKDLQKYLQLDKGAEKANQIILEHVATTMKKFFDMHPNKLVDAQLIQFH